MDMRHDRSAFSLIEIAIVLAIIGLLIGGVMVGTNLVRSAEVRGVITEYERYLAGTRTFETTYRKLPGDFHHATRYWGTAATCPGTNTTPSTTKATCNGNGDGVVTALATGTDAFGNTYGNEMYRYWQHLANAGMIEGRFTGTSNSATANTTLSDIGVNVPASRAKPMGWTFYFIGDVPIANVSYYEGYYGHTLIVGGVTTGGISNHWSNTLTPQEAWSIDSKLDDGQPATGNVRTLEAYGGNTMANNRCTDLAASNSLPRANAQYVFTWQQKACALVFITGL